MIKFAALLRRLCAGACVTASLLPCAFAQPAAPAPAPAPAPAASAPTTQHRDALRLVQAWLEAQQAYERLPSLTAAIVIGQQTVWSQAWGQADHRGQVPARTDTAYSICSISKLFTSVAVMQLAEQGKLSLDDDVGKWLPAFTMQRSDPDSGPISLRMLLMHSAGVPREGATSYWTAAGFPFPSRAELLAGLAGQQTFMRAGDHFQYSNLGMALLGEVVAAVSGMSYESYVQRHILDPLQLADTRPAMPAALWGQRLAQGHGALRRDGRRDTLPLFDARGLVPAAGYSSTALDLARFASWQFRLLKGGGQELLKVSTLREMQRVQWTDPDGQTTWGLGFWVGRDGGQTLVGHSGVCPGYLSSMTLVPGEQLAVIAMNNANDNRSLNRLTGPMRKLMLKGLKLPVAPPGGPRLEDYAGRYASQPWASENIVLPWGADLVTLDLPSNDPAGDLTVLRHVSGDTFKAVRADGSLGAEVVFLRDASGRVNAAREWNQQSAKLPP